MGMEFTPVGEVPAAKRGGGRRGSKWDEVVEKLVASQGIWHLIFTDESRPKVQGAHRYITTNYEVEIEAKTRAGENGTVELYARAL